MFADKTLLNKIRVKIEKISRTPSASDFVDLKLLIDELEENMRVNHQEVENIYYYRKLKERIKKRSQ